MALMRPLCMGLFEVNAAAQIADFAKAQIFLLGTVLIRDNTNVKALQKSKCLDAWRNRIRQMLFT